ncbi:MAG: hypothetical protein U0572_18160 [Phycisphaerales bacterium]
MRKSLAYSINAFAAIACVAGCTTQTETFPGKSRDQVWTALLRAAESPEYPDWHVIENDVWGYEADGRIEIWRLLRRYDDAPGQWSRMEDREWSFSVQLEPTEPPSATFKVRSLGVPSHGWGEGGIYFARVWTLLGGKPEPGSTPPVTTKEAEPATPAPSATGAPAATAQPAAPAPAASPVDVPSA